MEEISKREVLYSGKAKTIYATESHDRVIMHFRDDASAFDGKKRAELVNKGVVNNLFNAHIMQTLHNAGVPTHFVRKLSSRESLVKHMQMLPIECVLRNYAAGSICRRLGITEGIKLAPPVFEFFLKNDELGDPMINEAHIATFSWATPEQVQEMKRLTIKTNEILLSLFHSADILLVDFKLEFGLVDNKVVLGDEMTPDGCRLWDRSSREKLDKDRFRQDLGNIIESYQEVANRIGVDLSSVNA